ncbi:HAD family hydrolase [Actinomyces faecalis]|uniref:HAD family hydrolase n=1 Tax=Actinomyces faecalis TaxID=2722820 RepID=UPI0024681760|nr:HAD family hydrolase [Actinomyces faecalis]
MRTAVPASSSVITPLRPGLSRPDGEDLRLVVTDMDGTLLDGEGRVPRGLAQVVTRLRSRGIVFCPASGRQLANLRQTLGPLVAGSAIIAENGTIVLDGDRELFRDTISRQEAVTVVETVRRLAGPGAGLDVGAVVATPHVAYVERADERFLAQVDTYYASREVVPDLMELPLDDVLKVAVHDFVDAERLSAPHLAAAAPRLQAVVSGLHWTDLMPASASKGRALAVLQQRLGVTSAQTAVFGDYLNDLTLFDQAGMTFAMANAHPDILAAARFRAPAHTEAGVLRVLEELLGPVQAA